MQKSKVLRRASLENSLATKLVARWSVLSKARKEVIDIHTVYKILRFISEKREANVSQIVENVHISYSSANKYIVFLEDRGLITVEVKGRKKIIRITEKGYEFLILASRIYGMLNLKID